VTQPRSQPLPKDSDWLLSFLPAFANRGPRLLEIGCGPGQDAATLAGHGFEVVAFDRITLVAARKLAPRATLLRADLATPFPFRDACFDAALASLSLHYHPWGQTRSTVREIRRVLRDGTSFLFRVNASDDVHHGAGQGEELEPNFYRQPGTYHAETKRFFDEGMVRAMLEGLFAVEHLAHCTIHRYERPKQVWECLARAL
jgi:SAM-dependent methyltransferase